MTRGYDGRDKIIYREIQRNNLFYSELIKMVEKRERDLTKKKEMIEKIKDLWQLSTYEAMAKIERGTPLNIYLQKMRLLERLGGTSDNQVRAELVREINDRYNLLKTKKERWVALQGKVFAFNYALYEAAYRFGNRELTNLLREREARIQAAVDRLRPDFFKKKRNLNPLEEWIKVNELVERETRELMALSTDYRFSMRGELEEGPRFFTMAKINENLKKWREEAEKTHTQREEQEMEEHDVPVVREIYKVRELGPK